MGTYYFLWIRMGSAGNRRYSPSSYTYSVLHYSCFSLAADLCKWEGITPEKRCGAEQGQKRTQRRYRTIASSSSTVLFQKRKEKDLFILGRGQEHSASHTGPFLALTLPPRTAFLPHPVWPVVAFTPLHLPQCWQERRLARVSWLDRWMHGFFVLFVCVDWGTGNATKGVGLDPTKQCLSTFTFRQ